MFQLRTSFGNSLKDSSACITHNGKVIDFIEEERLVRTRHAIGSDNKLIKKRINKILDGVEDMTNHAPTEEAKGFKSPHHLNHAWNGYAQSGFDDAVILVIDGVDSHGEYSIGIYEAKGDDIKEIILLPKRYSLGILYTSGAHLCELGPNSEGKLMGLASYGKVIDDTPPFLIDLFNNNFNDIYGDNLGDYLKELLKKANIPEGSDFDFRYADIAATVQYWFELNVMSIVNFLSNNFKTSNLVISGGCALNCTTNGLILRSQYFDNVFIPTTCNDAGNTLGSALFATKTRLDKPLVYSANTYKRPEEFNKEINIYDIGEHLNSNKIIAWFEGGSEYGPRALCHRSLLARADNKYTLYRVNEIKQREYWRPLAPVIVDKYFKRIFDVSNERDISPLHKYMLATENLNGRTRKAYPAIDTPNGTSRPQVIDESNGLLYSVMDELGIALLINTSMNGRGEAICETPEDAIKFCDKHKDILLVFVEGDKMYIRG